LQLRRIDAAAIGMAVAVAAVAAVGKEIVAVILAIRCKSLARQMEWLTDSPNIESYSESDSDRDILRFTKIE